MFSGGGGGGGVDKVGCDPGCADCCVPCCVTPPWEIVVVVAGVIAVVAVAAGVTLLLGIVTIGTWVDVY